MQSVLHFIHRVVCTTCIQANEACTINLSGENMSHKIKSYYVAHFAVAVRKPISTNKVPLLYIFHMLYVWTVRT